MTTIPLTSVDRLVNFQVRFQDLAELLLDAVRYGTSPFAEDQYLRQRSWLLMNYKGVRDQLRPVMPGESNSKSKMGWPGAWLDPFEELMSAPTLERATRQSESDLTKRLKAVSTALDRAAGGVVSV